MKKTMKKLTAALLALACVPITALTASAIDITHTYMPWYWGETYWDAVEGKEPINDHGMVRGSNSLVYDGNGANSVVVLTPRMNNLRIVLREGTDAETDAMVDVLETYFPDIKASFNKEGYETGDVRWYNARHEYGDWQFFEKTWGISEEEIGRVYELELDDPAEYDAALEEHLLRDLAKAHLISGFYGWGATASYCVGYCGEHVLEDYPELDISDWDSVQTYLTERDPAYTLERYEGWTAQNGEVYYYYRVNGIDALSFRERIELAGELYEQFGMRVYFISPESAEETTLGHNALETKGDVTLDLELDIMDVIAVNKQLLGSASLCDTAVKNADVGGDGTLDETDSLAILKEVVGLTTNFAET